MNSDNRGSLSPKSLDEQIADLAAHRYGVFSHAEAIGAGASKSQIDRRLANGRWRPMHPRAYSLAGVPSSWRQAVLGACLFAGEGVAASHRSAAVLMKAPGLEARVVEISVPRGRRTRGRGIVVHEVRDLFAVDVTVVDAIPVTTPTRTLIDLGAVVPAEVVEDALDDALRRGLTSIRRLRWRIAELRRPGRPGIAVIEALVAARDGSKVPESVFETRLLRVLRQGGLQPVCQYEVRDEEGVMRLDFAYPNQRVAVEADGYATHSGRRDWERDLKRRNRLTALDWLLVHVTWTDLTHHPGRVVDEVRGALARRGGWAGQPR